MIMLTYPERRSVSESTIWTWFADARDNGEIDPDFYDASTTEEAVRALENAGLITVRR